MGHPALPLVRTRASSAIILFNMTEAKKIRLTSYADCAG